MAKNGRVTWSKAACGAHVCKVNGETGYAGRVITRVVDRDPKTGKGKTRYIAFLSVGNWSAENLGEFTTLQSAKANVEDTYWDNRWEDEKCGDDCCE